jgi:N-hydroxyarylamine O-acetyltransferase
VQTRTDYELSSWYTSTHPASIFVQFLIVARPFPDRRVTLFNTDLTIRHLDGRVEARRLDTPEEIAAALDEYFGLTLSAEDRTLILDPYMDAWRAMVAA